MLCPSALLMSLVAMLFVSHFVSCKDLGQDTELQEDEQEDEERTNLVLPDSLQSLEDLHLQTTFWASQQREAQGRASGAGIYEKANRENHEMGKSNETMDLTIKFGVKNIPMSLPASSKVSNLMQQLQTATGVLPRVQKLIFKGKLLTPDLTLKNAQLKDGSKIMLMAAQGFQSRKYITMQQLKEALAFPRKRIAMWQLKDDLAVAFLSMRVDPIYSVYLPEIPYSVPMSHWVPIFTRRIMHELNEKERENAQEERKEYMVEYRQFLESCDFIKATTQWREVQDRLEDDEWCSQLDKLDRLEVFEEYIQELEKEEEKEKRLQKGKMVRLGDSDSAEGIDMDSAVTRYWKSSKVAVPLYLTHGCENALDFHHKPQYKPSIEDLSYLLRD